MPATWDDGVTRWDNGVTNWDETTSAFAPAFSEQVVVFMSTTGEALSGSITDVSQYVLGYINDGE